MNFDSYKPSIAMRQLKKASKINPDGIIRLAKFLKLRIDDMSIGQICRLIRWRITREEKRLRGMAWRW